MSISAFGVEHGEISKLNLPLGEWGAKAAGGLKRLTGGLGEAGRGARAGASGMIGPQRSATGQLGARAGSMGRSGAKYTRANLKPIGIGVGAGGVAGYGMHRNNNGYQQ